MKAHLMYRDRDLDLEQDPPANAEALMQDLELDTLFDAMARGDKYLRDVTRSCLLSGLAEPEAIRYRQSVLADCIEHSATVRQLYDLAVEALESKKKAQVFWFRDSPDALLQKSVRILELLADVLRQLRELVDEHAAAFGSDGFTRLFATLEEELDDAYLQTVEYHLRELTFRRGALISARLGRGNRGTRYVLRKPHQQSLLQRITPGKPPSYSFTVPARDDNGLRALSELRDKGINLVAAALAQSTDHILNFFSALRAELGFYVACVNLHEQLVEKRQPTCFPVPLPVGRPAFSATELYDVSLVFHLDSKVVGNTVDADGKALVMITGANQGGKSTFLRSVGLAQLMMQAGMFIGAESFSANVRDGLFTHYKREEDATMTLGKLEEELSRMSEIADRIGETSLLLYNESFASTNEREGSEIARQVVQPLIDAGVKVFFVTHLFDLASGFYRQQRDDMLFLRAERQPKGRRTFRVLEGEPLPTSYGADSYRRIFGAAPDVPAAAALPDR
jgi:DNA mismatch repair ATPase MutS